MKLLKRIVCGLAPVIFSCTALAAPSSQIQCSAIDFDIKIKNSPHSIPLRMNESTDYISFEGKSKTATFWVNINKKSLEILSTITLSDSTAVQNQGSFDSHGRYESTLMRGGNIMMPATALAIGCYK